MAHHKLKTWPEFYSAIERGDKTFEARYNDRNYKVGDTLELEEYDPEKDLGVYTGRRAHFRVSYVLHGGGFGIERGYVIMGLKPMEVLHA